MLWPKFFLLPKFRAHSTNFFHWQRRTKYTRDQCYDMMKILAVVTQNTANHFAKNDHM
jgi:hypothetical protein